MVLAYSGYYDRYDCYYLTPEQITLDCLDWVGGVRWTDPILCNPLPGQPQKAYDEETVCISDANDCNIRPYGGHAQTWGTFF